MDLLDDGIYVLVKEVVDNSIDEFVMGNGKKIFVKINDDVVEVRDYVGILWEGQRCCL